MKIAPRQVDEFINRPKAEIAAVLIYGPDQGLVRERAEQLVKSIVSDINDPFLITALTGSSLRQDAAVLSDNAAALSFSQGRRAIRVRDVTDTHTKIFAAFLEEPKGDSLVIVEAGELAARSSLRKTFEQADNAAALACYADDDRRLHQVITETLQSHGITVSREAMDYLLSQLGADRMVTRNELDKLALYMEEGGTVTLEDAQLCIGDSAAASMDGIIYAVGSGDQAALDVSLRRVMAEGAQPVQILRALARHLQRLQLAASYVQAGQSPEQAMKALRPPVIFLFENQFRFQLSIWPVRRLADAIDVILEAELNCKTTGMPAEHVCARALMRIAQGARVMAQHRSQRVRA
ncbi:MAG: DNA polymerase III subunit delta [Rhodospirillales bacterium]